MCLQYRPFENTVGKGEIARNEQFLLFPQCFISFWRTFCQCKQVLNCRLQSLSLWKSLKFVVWERVKLLSVTDPLLPITYSKSIGECNTILSACTVKPVLETTCIKRPPAITDHCSDTATLLKST